MDSLIELTAALNAYAERAGVQLDGAQLEALKEVRARLARLEPQYNDLLRLNEELLATDLRLPRTSFDPDTDTITVGSGKDAIRIKLERADPAVPIEMRGSAVTAAYRAGGASDDNEVRAKLKAQMETLLEDFYHSAHRIQKLIATITGRSKSKATKVTVIRNKLVAHPDPGDFYSFGYSSNGPTVRPIHRSGRPWVDEGLIPNVNDFVAKMVVALR
jgi:hypothetical protein